MRPIATQVALFRRQLTLYFVCQSVGHIDEPRHGLVRAGDSKNHVLDYGPIPHGHGHVLGSYLGMPRVACDLYSQPYSLGGGSDAASGHQSTVATCWRNTCGGVVGAVGVSCRPAEREPADVALVVGAEHYIEVVAAGGEVGRQRTAAELAE